MKIPSSFLTNTTAPANRTQGQAINDPGGSTGSGVDQEIYNDPAYAVIAMGESWKEGGVSDSDENTLNSDLRDSVEEMVSKKVVGVATYNPATNYVLPGEKSNLVMWKGFQFINISNVGNLGNDPLLNPLLWYKIPKVDKLMDEFYSGEPVSGGLSDLADRAGSKYLQNLIFGNYRLGGNGDDFYDFSRVALDGSIVTGNATLEAILDVGGLNQYWNLDIIAPDVLGTRTLLDMGERVLAAQSVSGENDVMGEVLEDQGQGHHHIAMYTDETSPSINLTTNNFRTVRPSDASTLGSNTATTIINNIKHVTDPIADLSNGTPRVGSTTRPKELTVGASYIIVMNAA